MKMLMIILKESLEEDVRALLRKEGVAAFTELKEVTGRGEAGSTLHSLPWPGYNNLILTALSEMEATRVIAALTGFRDGLAEKQHGAKIPLRVFALPCELVV